MFLAEEKNFIESYGSFIASFFASLVALSIAIWGWKMGSWFKRPKLKVIRLKKYNQNGGLNVWRILIKNVGNETAKNVESEIIEVYDGAIKRENFLPCPLRWANRQNLESYRSLMNILPGQTAFVDLLDEFYRDGKLNMRFGTVISLDDIKDFSYLSNDRSMIKVGIFCENYKTLYFNFKFNLAKRET